LIGYDVTESPGAIENFAERVHAIEDARAEINRRERVTMLGLLPLAAAFALIIPYMEIVITLQEADYYYILERPDMDTYLRLAGAALFAGPIAIGLIFPIFRQLDDFLPTYGRMLVVALAYGIIMPFLTGMFTPFNLFVTGVTGISNVTNQGSLGEMFSDWIFSTPMFTFLFWIDWLGPSIFFGLIACSLFWLVVRFAGPVEDAARARFIYLGSSAVAIAVLFLLIVWPFGLFDYMFETLL
jgi:hypothetical protein